MWGVIDGGLLCSWLTFVCDVCVLREVCGMY